MKRLSGSITVFLSFVLTMVLGLFFTMSEVLRFFCLKKQTDRASLISVESCFADYCRPLWEEYGLLGVDLSYGKSELDKETFEKRFYRYLDENGNADGTHFFQAYPRKAGLLDYSVLTDNDFSGLVREAAKSVENNVGSDMISMLSELTDKVKSAEERSGGLSDLAESGEDVMNGNAPPASVSTVPGSEPSEETKEKIRGCPNPLINVFPVGIGGILKTVLPVDADISKESLMISKSERASRRTLERGTMQTDAPKAHEKLLYDYWLSKTFRTYTQEARENSVKYEMEYVICGKDSDVENLKGTVWRLLLLREGLNMASICKDSARVGETETLALIIATLLTQPELKDVVKYVILALWSYVESILDLRTLTDGGKVPLIKSPADWNSDLWTLITDIYTGRKAKEGSGLKVDYNGYLLAFAAMTPVKTSAGRACDLMEEHIRRSEDYKNIRMDRLLYRGDLLAEYQAKPLFLSFVPLFTGEWKVYDFSYRRRLSYVDGEELLTASKGPPQEAG